MTLRRTHRRTLRLRTTPLLALAALGGLVLPIPAHAATEFFANLTNGQENPPVTPTFQNGQPRPASFGFASLLLNDDQTALTFTVTVFNIDFTGTQTADTNDDLRAAHIHSGPNLPPGNNPVAFGFIGTPFNDTVSNDTVVAAFTGVGQVGGTVTSKWDVNEGNNTTLTAQLGNLFSGGAYLNFHTAQFPGGEVRGQIVAVPEPATLPLIGLALAGGAALRARRRKAA